MMSAQSIISTEKDHYHTRIAILVCHGRGGTIRQAVLTSECFKRLYPK